ncbi:MAG: NUDIX hydrolase [Pseudomonadota bacterium]
MNQINRMYSGRVIEVNVERVKLPNGTTADLEIIHHPGGAAIMAVDDHENVCLLRQFRHAAGGWIWELPAGRLEPGEPPLETARRELIEEAGRTAQHWQQLGLILSSPGVFTERIYLYLARGLAHCPQALEKHEVIEVHWIPLTEAVAMAHDGRINDAKSVIGLLRGSAFRDQHSKP